MDLPEDKRQAIREALFEGRTIEAIKLVREVAGCGLKEAKDFVDRYAADLRKQEPEKFTAAAGRGCFGLILLGIGIGFAAGSGLAVLGVKMLN